MKKILLAFGAAAVIGALAFGQDTMKKPIIGVAIPSADHGWTGGVVYFANKTKADIEKMYPGTTVIVKTAKDAAEQANQVQDLFTVNKIDTLVVLPYESAPLTTPIKNIHDKGVFVTVVDRGLTDESAQDAYVAGDNPGMGKVSAEYMGKKMNGIGNIVVLRGIATVIDNQRVDAFEAVMKSKYPKIKILDKKYANWNRDDGFKVMQDFLTRFKKIDAVWAQDDDIAVGVLKAMDQAKRKDIKFVLGGAGSKEFIKKVMDGDPLITADVTYSPSMIRDAMNLTAKARVTGSKMPARTIIPSVLVTKANAKDYYFPDSPF
jgi:ribose transport system substrate-binding protein